jgi:hypothetical protein
MSSSRGYPHLAVNESRTGSSTLDRRCGSACPRLHVHTSTG